jgi:hypothetical protein
VPQPLPGIAPAGTPFDADIGPGPDGNPVIVYARCRVATCHLFRTTPGGGSETKIAGAASTGGSESAPTVWGAKLAFARVYRGRRASAAVYIRTLDAPKRVRSTRLPGVPATICERGGKACRPITDGRVPELELRGSTLAESVRFSLRNQGICGAGQVRLVGARTRSSRLVAAHVCGLSGQTWIGLSLTPSQLLFAEICPGDPSGCQNHGAIAYRYTLGTRTFEHALQPDPLAGFAAVDADHALEIREPERGSGRCDNYAGARPSCALTLAGPLPFGPGRR